jgi:hypothetical protein
VEPLARLYGLCAGYLVLSLGGARAVVIGLAESFGDARLGVPRLDGPTFALGSVQLVVDALATALGLALPLLVAAWLVEASFALVGRALASGLPSDAGLLRSVVYVVAAALLLVPTASLAPDAVRGAIGSARALTRALGK